jgi:hypothetical protein
VITLLFDGDRAPALAVACTLLVLDIPTRATVTTQIKKALICNRSIAKSMRLREKNM